MTYIPESAFLENKDTTFLEKPDTPDYNRMVGRYRDFISLPLNNSANENPMICTTSPIVDDFVMYGPLGKLGRNPLQFFLGLGLLGLQSKNFPSTYPIFLPIFAYPISCLFGYLGEQLYYLTEDIPVNFTPQHFDMLTFSVFDQNVYVSNSEIRTNIASCNTCELGHGLNLVFSYNNYNPVFSFDEERDLIQGYCNHLTNSLKFSVEGYVRLGRFGVAIGIYPMSGSLYENFDINASNIEILKRNKVKLVTWLNNPQLVFIQNTYKKEIDPNTFDFICSSFESFADFVKQTVLPEKVNSFKFFQVTPLYLAGLLKNPSVNANVFASYLAVASYESGLLQISSYENAPPEFTVEDNIPVDYKLVDSKVTSGNKYFVPADKMYLSYDEYKSNAAPTKKDYYNLAGFFHSMIEFKKYSSLRICLGLAAITFFNYINNTKESWVFGFSRCMIFENLLYTGLHLRCATASILNQCVHPFYTSGLLNNLSDWNSAIMWEFGLDLSLGLISKFLVEFSLFGTFNHYADKCVRQMSIAAIVAAKFAEYFSKESL